MFQLLFFYDIFYTKNTEKLSSVFFVSSLLGLDVNSYFFKQKNTCHTTGKRVCLKEIDK